MEEKRLYSRLKSGMPCLIYSNNKEYVGVVDNISENGIAIYLDRGDQPQKLDLNGQFFVTGLDEDDVVQFHVDVRRISEKDGKVLIGTHVINSDEIGPYVHEKRLEILKKKCMQQHI